MTCALLGTFRCLLVCSLLVASACGGGARRGAPAGDDDTVADTDVTGDDDLPDGGPGDGASRQLGVLCTSAAACDSGFCVDGVCCDGGCEGVCRTCALPGAAGNCSPLRLVEDDQCAFSGGGARMCDAAGVCTAPHLLADINTTGGPTQLTALANGSLVFEANAAGAGRELWVADADGARLLSDINPGVGPSDIRDAAVLGDYVVFDADDGTTGRELYATDGVASYQIRDVALGPVSSMALSGGRRFVPFDGWLYFVANEGVAASNLQLWRTDGVLAEKIQINASGSAFESQTDPPFVFNGSLFVAASASTFPNTRLWRINAGGATPTATTGIAVEPASPFYDGRRAASGGFIYMTCNSASSVGSEPCRSDGVTVQNLADIIAGGTGGPYANDFVALGGWVYFTAYSTGAFPGDPQIWRTNGAQTTRFTNLNPGSGAEALHLTAVGGLLFFTARDGTSSGHDLWVTDGSTMGLRKLTSGGETYDGITVLATADTPSGPSLFFARADLLQGAELWRSTGTAQTTVQLTDFPGGKSAEPALLAQTSWLYFAIDTPENGRELAYWHPTLDVHGVIDLEPGVLSSSPSNAIVDAATGDIYFTAARGGVFWLMKIPLLGQPAGVTSVAPIDFGEHGSAPRAFAQTADGRTYFAADDSVHGSELWMTPGSSGDVALAYDLTATRSPFGSSLSSDIRAVGALGNQLFMGVAYEGPVGLVWHLWATDAAGASPAPFADDGGGLGLEIGAAARFRAMGGTMFWNALGTLYASDGSEVGTRPIGPCRVDQAGPSQALGGVLNGELYYYGGTGDADDALWRTSGGTPELVLDTYPGHADAIRSFAVRDGAIFFLAKDDVGVDRVWSSGADPAETLPGFGDPSLTLADLAVLGDRLWLVTKDGMGTQRLGYLDEVGLTFTTVKELGIDVPGSFSPTALGPHLFFRAPAASGGWSELWFTDGTLTAPACAGFGCRAPDALTVVGERLYLQADVGGGAEVVVFP